MSKESDPFAAPRFVPFGCSMSPESAPAGSIDSPPEISLLFMAPSSESDSNEVFDLSSSEEEHLVGKDLDSLEIKRPDTVVAAGLQHESLSEIIDRLQNRLAEVKDAVNTAEAEAATLEASIDENEFLQTTKIDSLITELKEREVTLKHQIEQAKVSHARELRDFKRTSDELAQSELVEERERVSAEEDRLEESLLAFQNSLSVQIEEEKQQHLGQIHLMKQEMSDLLSLQRRLERERLGSAQYYDTELKTMRHTVFEQTKRLNEIKSRIEIERERHTQELDQIKQQNREKIQIMQQRIQRLMDRIEIPQDTIVTEEQQSSNSGDSDSHITDSDGSSDEMDL